MKTLPLPEIVSRLAAITGDQQVVTEKFVSDFSAIVTDALLADGTLSIRGLGRFRVIETAGETSVEFAPDAAMSEAVNAPFAMFEPVELDDSVTMDMLAESDEPQKAESETDSHEAETPSVELNEEIVETKDGYHDIHDEEPAENNSAPVENVLADKSDEMPAGMPPIPPRYSEPDPEPAPEYAAMPEPEHVAATASCRHKEESMHYRHEEVPPCYSTDRERRSHHGWIVALTAVAALLAGFVAGYFVYERINLSDVKNVNISAEDVQVYHRMASDGDIAAASVTEADDSAKTTATEVAENDAAAAVAPHADIADAEKNAASDAVVTDTVRPGRFLTTMALKHYGKKKFWVYIYEENRDILGDPDLIAPNTVVLIPPAEKYGIKPGDKASEDDAQRRATAIMNRYSK